MKRSLRTREAEINDPCIGSLEDQNARQKAIVTSALWSEDYFKGNGQMDLEE